jgi:hypothetical protein
VSNFSEIRQELSDLLSGRMAVADGVVPPLVFVGVNAVWGLNPAAITGVGSAIAIISWRLRKGRRLRFALAGLVGTLLAVALALRSGSAEDYFVPGIISGALTSLAILVSIVSRRPFVAWTSWVTRGWPLEWYWHPRVRPAYTRVTWMWLVFFAARTLVQGYLYQAGSTEMLGLVRVVLGWPALLVLLVATYVLGRRWLVRLEGPSVAEFEDGAEAPWQGQPRGF